MNVPYLIKHNFLSDLKLRQVMSELNQLSSLPGVLNNNETTHGTGVLQIWRHGMPYG